jgi:hypothetical protein
MTTQDQNKKTLRSFQCRDYLWELFEQMSGELECSTDYLVNEAMRQYARSRNYGTHRRDTGGSSVAAQPPAPANPSLASQALIPSLRDNVPVRNETPMPTTLRPVRGGVVGTVGPAPRPVPSMPPPPPPVRPSVTHATRGEISMPPPIPVSRAAAPAVVVPSRPYLYVIFNGQKIPVTKDEFIIGRGSRSADLPIKDGNISRRHAAVVWHNGSYYMKDLGSTNGIEFQGRRFDTKRIDEGDLFRMCDYELRFTYQ